MQNLRSLHAQSPGGAASGSPWFPHASAKPQAALRLFCFPYAGGSAAIYRPWAASLPPAIELCAVQLPGRGERLDEPSYTDLRALVGDAEAALLPYLDKPFALFGHSMGAMIAFELARRLRDRGLNPVHLFLSARRAPQLEVEEEITYNLPEPEFIDEVRRLNGTPQEVLEHPELMQMVLPLLRADFEVVETYRYEPGAPLDCPVTVFGGLQDSDVPRPQLDAWREHTTAAFSVRMLPGDHFFLHKTQPLLTRVVVQELSHPRGGDLL
jgi:medium-chain acyl-[acyl-carrier-protein] hydrolase